MNKIIILVLALFFITGCNRDVIDLEYDFDKIICNYDGIQFELNIDSWVDYDGEQIQIKSGEKVYVVSANKCYMIGDK